MKKIICTLAILFALPACTDIYGRPDPVATGLLGAGIGGVAGYALGRSVAPNPPVVYHYHSRPRIWAPPPPRPYYFHRHYDFRPRYRHHW
jgi:hypothetical protein